MITETNLIKIKHKLSEKGHGAKKELAEHLGINQAQVSLLLKYGIITAAKEESLLAWLKGKK